MGCSIEIEAFKAPDAKWQKMKAVYDACAAAGINMPEEVDRFFGYGVPNECGVKVDISSATTVSRDDDSENYMVDIRKLPKDTIMIKFSYSC